VHNPPGHTTGPRARTWKTTRTSSSSTRRRSPLSSRRSSRGTGTEPLWIHANTRTNRGWKRHQSKREQQHPTGRRRRRGTWQARTSRSFTPRTASGRSASRRKTKSGSRHVRKPWIRAINHARYANRRKGTRTFGTPDEVQKAARGVSLVAFCLRIMRDSVSSSVSP
jgi:hypothetical protein